MDLKRDQIWQSPNLKMAIEGLPGWVCARNDSHDSPESHEPHHDGRTFSQFVMQAQTLQRLATHHATSICDVEKVYRDALETLSDAKVDPRRSNLNWIYRWLERHLAEAYRCRGNAWLAQWYEQLSESTVESTQSWQYFLRQGDIPELLYAVDRNADLALAERREILARCMILTGDAIAAFGQLASDSDPWLRIRAQVMLERDAQLMLEYLRSYKRPDRPDLWSDWSGEAKLWAYALPSRKMLNESGSIGSTSDLVLNKCLQVLKQCYDQDRSFEDRYAALGSVGQRAADLSNPEYEILFWGAGARWLHRQRHEVGYQIFRSELRKLSLAFSDGRSEDVFRLLTDIEERKVTRYATPPASWWDRSKAYGNLTTQTLRILGSRQTSQLARQKLVLADLSEQQIQDLAVVLSQHMEQLKGPVMKLGQIAGYAISRLSPDVQGLFSQFSNGPSHALNPKDAEINLNQMLGHSWKNSFKQVDWNPIGTGSLGQVHAGVRHDGREVAIKVQYPNMYQALRVDFRLLRGVTPILRLLLGRPIRPLVDELEAKMFEELDYSQEATTMRDFAQRFSAYREITIPAVHSDLSSRQLLVMDRMMGVKYREFCGTASQDQKDHAGRALVRFVVRSCVDGHFNTDPHPGNFLFAPHSNRLICLDFGSIKKWDLQKTRLWRNLVASCVTHDLNLFRETALEMGLVNNSKSHDFTRSFELLTADVEGLWTRPGFQPLSQRVMEDQLLGIFAVDAQTRAQALPPEYVFGFRVYFGHIATVAGLGARADWNQLVREVLKI